MKQVIIKQMMPRHFFIIMGMVLLLPFSQLNAQGRKPGGGGGAKPAASRPTPSKQPASKPAAQKAAPSRPAATKSAPSRPEANKSDIKKPGSDNDGGRRPGGDKDGDKRTNISNSGNKTNNIGSNNNKVNIDNSKKNVNVNVDKSKNVRVNNSRNTSVRRNTRPYARPPYVYGGRRYRCYHPFVFHPYRPFIWGPMWHPWGFFVATLATTAIILSVDNYTAGDLDMASNNNAGFGDYAFEMQPALSGPAMVSIPSYQLSSTVFADQYYYDAGVYYIKEEGGYTVVAAPVGAVVKTLPSGYETVTLDDKTTNYYYGGAFYEKTSAGYKVVPPTSGAVVSNVSEGGEEVKMGEITYVKLGETYFQPIQENGKDMYEVADVEDDK